MAIASTVLKPQEHRQVSEAVLIPEIVDRSVHIIMNPKVLVVVPCYNEEISIGSVVLRSLAYASKVVVVDDGSHDKTAEIARLAGAEVIPHEVNKGKGAGIRTAFAYAKDAGADVLVLIDGDGQHNPDEIPQLIEPIVKGEADMVNGSRFLVKNRHHVPGYRRIGQDLLTLATNAGSGHKITDSQNGFRAFARGTFDCFTFQETGMGIESEMLMDAARSNLRIREVQIDVRYDVAGSTYNPVVHGISVMGSVIALILKRRHVISYGLPGLALLAAGIAGVSYLALGARDIAYGTALGYAALSLMCFTIGILCIFSLLTLVPLRNPWRQAPSSVGDHTEIQGKDHENLHIN